MTDQITITRALLEQALESLWQMTKKFNFERLHESRLSDSKVRVAAHDAMNAIRAELAKPVEPQKTDVFGITTAYEQGVGKGHQSKVRGEIACPYAEGDYAQAWNLGYTEGKEQADRLQIEPAKPVEQKNPITLDQFRAIANRTATTYRHRSDPEKSSYAFVDGSSLDDFWRKVCEAIQPTPAWHDAPEVAALKAERDELLKLINRRKIHPYDFPLEIFIADLSTRTANVLRAEFDSFRHTDGTYDIEPPFTVRHLLMFSRQEIKKWPGIGKKGLNEIEENLRARGLQLWHAHDDRSLRLLREHKSYFVDPAKAKGGAA